jgi:hypothetical protein
MCIRVMYAIRSLTSRKTNCSAEGHIGAALDRRQLELSAPGSRRADAGGVNHAATALLRVADEAKTAKLPAEDQPPAKPLPALSLV